MIRRMFSVCVIGCVLMIVCSFAAAAAAEEESKKAAGYETKYDNIDLDELLGNDRLRKNYVKCLMGQGPCSPDALELKNAIATNCSKCTEKQKSGSEKVTHYLIDRQPDEWDQLATIYDKDGEYKRSYLESKAGGGGGGNGGGDGEESTKTENEESITEQQRR